MSDFKRTHGWVFTINNYSQEDLDKGADLFKGYIYMGYAKEVAASGTPHLQGYVYFEEQKRFTQVKKMHSRASFQNQRGTNQQARDYYCVSTPEKPNINADDVFEWGTMPLNQGMAGSMAMKRKYDDAHALAVEGRLPEIEPMLLVRHFSNLRGIASLHQAVIPKRTTLDNYWFWGKTGTGKSMTADKLWPDHYMKMVNKWWDGYSNHDVAVMEEFSPDMAQFLVQKIKIWSDYKAFPAEVKCGTIAIRPQTFVITSNYHPRECFNSVDLEPILRRFKVSEFISEEDC